MTEKIFCLKPRYVDEFKCDGAKCGALCCRSAWNIYIDAKTYEKYSELDLYEMTRHLQRDAAGDKYLLIPNSNGCPMLGDDNLCTIQKTHGENYLSQVCAGYPRIVTRFGNFLELALSPTCPVAAKIFLLADVPLKFTVVEADEKILRLGANNILQGISPEFAPLLVDVQLAMISILQERRLSLDGRLIVLGFFLDRVEELIINGKLDGATLKRLAAVYTSEKFLSEQVPLMLTAVRFDASRKILPAEFATLAENFLVNEIILGAFPWRIDAGVAKNFGVFLTVYRILARQLRIDDPLKAASDLSRKIDHSDEIAQIAERLDAGDMLTLLEKFFGTENL